MVVKSKLKMALAAEKNTDFKKIKEKRRLKQLHKTKATKTVRPEEPNEEWEDEEPDSDSEQDESANGINYEALNESDSDDSEVEMEEKIERVKKTAQTPATAPAKASKNDEDEDEDEDEEDIPMSDLDDLDDEDKEDLMPHTRLTIYNKDALITSLNRIIVPSDASVPFVSHMCVVSPTPTTSAIADVSDDVQREDAFLAQCLAAVKLARSKLVNDGVPFTRPTDYFAEMVKSDDHMGKIKDKIVAEASAKKASAEARKLRELKKFGKKTQVAKIQERAKEKRETLDKIKNLKRKRQENTNDVGTHEAGEFDVAVDNELKTFRNKSEANGRFSGNGPNAKRIKKNDKYGFGGKKRHLKSGDSKSSGDLSDFSQKRNKAPFSSTSAGGGKKRVPTQRLGKARRKAIASRR
ncbi:rRNA-processing protein EBP2 [Ceratocystis pirilliformis]|uniref:rRNA-processing protein EBP2 n=1 Tax=Ceratocystis pirilliformis TaxID=259994 RepID=A0ABR3ZHA1_9PEZI